MKQIFLLLFFSTFTFAVDPATHGMVIFGGQYAKIYASHMPRFKAPFNYQAIFELELSDETKDAYLTAISQPTNKLITLVTEEQIVLADLVKNPKTFRASLYVGHYEKANSFPIEINTEVKIKGTVYFKELDANASKPKEVEYLYFGTYNSQIGTAEFHLAHKITAPGDFDQILQGIVHPIYIFPEKYRTYTLLGEKEGIDFEAVKKGTKVYKTYETSDATKQEYQIYAGNEYFLETESLKK